MKNYSWKILRTPRYHFTDLMLMVHFAYFVRRIKRYYILTILTRHPNIRFIMEKEIDHNIPFSDVLINSDSHVPVTSVYRKKTFTRLLTDYFSFTSHSYKLGFIPRLVDRAYKINKTWLGFHEDITKVTNILQKNLFPVHLVENIINRYKVTFSLQYGNPPASVSDTKRITLHWSFFYYHAK